MKSRIYKNLMAFLFLIAISPGLTLSYAQAVKADNFAPGQLEAHFEKHGDQFGGITEEQYLQAARNLLDAAPSSDILEKIRYNGDVEHFMVSTGEFAVMTKRGRIRTLFKTSYQYWMRQ